MISAALAAVSPLFMAAPHSHQGFKEAMEAAALSALLTPISPRAMNDLALKVRQFHRIIINNAQACRHQRLQGTTEAVTRAHQRQ